MYRLSLIICSLAVVLVFGGCQLEEIDSDPSEVSLNRVEMSNSDPQEYRFLVIGHAYGGIEMDDHLPGKHLLQNLNNLKAMNLSMLVSLGDMVMHSVPEEFDLLHQHLISAVSFPIFNTPGNHDVEDRALYESRFGQTYYTFRYGSARFIFLDTEIKSCQINTAQQQLLGKALKAGLSNRDTKNIFIFMHKTLFLRNDFLFASQKSWAMPNVWTCYNNTNFTRIMEEQVIPAARRKPIYLFAGDVGAWGNLSPYYERREEIPLTMVMTGLGDNLSDSGILVTITGQDVILEVYSFTDQQLPSLDSFNAEYWNRSSMREEIRP